MRYTQGQVRDLLGISIDTFRVWRETIPALRQHRGHGPTFTPGDIVALAALSDLVRLFGVRVGTLNSLLNDMFLTCRGMSWQSLSECVITFQSDEFNLLTSSSVNHHLYRQHAILSLPCAPIIQRLHNSLLATETHLAQGHLSLPPTAIR